MMTTLHRRAPPASPVTPSAEVAWAVLESVPDPEIPVVSLRELGILRDVAHDVATGWTVTITPTYSGCPAMAQIAEDIGSAMQQAGLVPWQIRTVLAPAWTTDWMTDEAKAKLRAYGIAPPSQCAAPETQTLHFRPWAAKEEHPACPQCHSTHTTRLAQHGSTACKALYRCLACGEPFDYFKPY